MFAEIEELWKPIPEENYADILELVALRAKANYEEIISWQGQMNILEISHHYGAVASKLRMIDTKSLKNESQHICVTSKTIANFSVDMQNNKLYSYTEPSIPQYKAVDLDQNVPMAKGIRVNKVKTILTQEIWMNYEPDSKYASKGRERIPEKTVFIDKPQEIKGGLNGEIRDPRIFFESGGEKKKLWETLMQIREVYLQKGNVRIMNFPHIEIFVMETQNGKQYRIISTWKGGENYTIKYIRTVIEVAENVGFNAIQVEVISPDGIKLTSKQYTYEDFNGIYIPKIIREIQLNSKGETKISSEISIENQRVNSIIPDDTFSVKNLALEEDTLVIDKVEKAEFRYKKGNLVPIEEPNK